MPNLGAIFGPYDPQAIEGQKTAMDSELPWPYCPPINVVWRNGVGMPVKMLPNWTLKTYVR